MIAEPLPRYYVGFQRARYVFVGLATVVLTAVLAAMGVVVSLFDSGGRWPLALARIWARLLLRIAGIRTHVSGLDGLDPDGAYVFVANHTSALDIPALIAALPYPLRMLAKASLFKMPFLGWYIRRVGYIPVDRQDPRGARQIIRQALAGAGRGGSIVVFPEGTRSPEGDLTEFKRGALFLARESGLPIVPVAIVNAGYLLPRGESRVDPGIVEIRVGEPILADGQQPTRKLTQTIHDRVRSLIDADRAR